MAPSAVETTTQATTDIRSKLSSTAGESVSRISSAPKEILTEELPELRTGHREPIKSTGALDQYEHFEVTPVIGREYVNVNLLELLRAPNSDDLIRELALISECQYVAEGLVSPSRQ